MMPPIGEQRYQKWFNVRSAIETGMPVGFGSDWASSLIPDPNGFHQMQSWITRRDPAQPESATLNVGQKISLEQAVHGFTLGGAKGARLRLGKESRVDREQAEGQLDVVEVEITNKDLDNAVDAAELNLLVEIELYAGSCRCSGGTPHIIGPGSASTPEEVTQAFGNLMNQGYRYARPGRQIEWKDEGEFWIQWTLKGEDAVLWAYDPEVGKAVEILQVREK